MYDEAAQGRAESEVDGVLRALAHPFRRAVVAGLARARYRAPQRVYSLAPGALDPLAGWVAGTSRADPGDGVPFEVEG